MTPANTSGQTVKSEEGGR